MPWGKKFFLGYWTVSYRIKEGLFFLWVLGSKPLLYDNDIHSTLQDREIYQEAPTEYAYID